MVETETKPVDEVKPEENATSGEAAPAEEEEQSPMVEETFSEPACSEFEFASQWTLWEHYEAPGSGGNMDYASSMCKVCWFNDVVSFSTAWRSIPHRELANIFFNEQTRTVKLVQVKGQELRVNGMSLFLTHLQPKWEDDVNKNGGEFRIDFKSNLVFLQTIWEKLVFDVVSGEFSGAEMLAGIRLLDKSSLGRESVFRIEVWTKFDSTHQEMVSNLKKHLEEEYVSLMIDDQGTQPSNNKANSMVASEWLAKFKNHQENPAEKPRQPPQPAAAPQ